MDMKIFNIYILLNVITNSKTASQNHSLLSWQEFLIFTSQVGKNSIDVMVVDKNV